MATYKRYARREIVEAKPFEPGDDLTGFFISESDLASGSPKAGDMLVRNPKNEHEKRLLSAREFDNTFSTASGDEDNYVWGT